ncbi:hypothetical protein [Desulfospira joergensenii]|nr:hypothetical protein [Desulfospira joergensenii]
MKQKQKEKKGSLQKSEGFRSQGIQDGSHRHMAQRSCTGEDEALLIPLKI